MRKLPLLLLFIFAGTAHAQLGIGINHNTTLTGTGSTSSPLGVNMTTIAGAGLSNGGTTLDIGAGTGITVAADSISVNTAVIQARISGTCTTPLSIVSIGADGSVVCSTNGIDGTGTGGRSARWTDANTLATGAFTDDGTNATLGGTLGVTGLSTLTGGATSPANIVTTGSGFFDTAAYITTDTIFAHSGGVTPVTVGAGGGLAVTNDISGSGNLSLAGTASVATATSKFLNVGRPASSTTAADNGMSIYPFTDGNIYVDHKLGTAGSVIHRIGQGTEAGSTRNWLTVTGSTGAAAFGNSLTATTSITAYSTISGATNVSGALGAGNSVASTTAADVGWAVGLDRSGGSVYLDSKLGTGASLVGRIGAGTSSGQTNVWLQVDGSGNATLPKNTEIGDASTDAVGIGTAPDSDSAVTFANAVGDKLALYRDSSTAAYGIGVQSSTMQLFTANSSTFISLGYGDSDAFTESQRLDADGQVWFGDTANSGVSNNLDVLTLGNTGTGQTADGLALVEASDTGSYLGANGSAANSYGLRIVKDSSCSDCTVANSKGHNNIGAFFSTHGDESGDNAVTNWSLATEHGYAWLNIDPDYTTQIGGLLYIAPSKGIVVESIAAYNSGGTLSTGGGPGTPGGSSYSYGSGTGNLSINANTGGTLSLFANGSGFINIGDSSGDLATFSNGPAGINTYAGKHLEWADEWTGISTALTAAGWPGMPLGAYFLAGNGTGAQIAGLGTAATRRPGLVSVSTGTTTTGYMNISTSPESVSYADNTTTTYEWAGAVPTLSTAGEEYTLLVGGSDTAGSANQVDGCYFLYDRGGVATDPTTGDTGAGALTGDKFQIWCVQNSTRTGYLLDGTASEDSFTTVSSAVVAGTYYRLKVVLEGTTKARFYIDGTEVGRITTNIPNGSTTRMTGMGVQILKSAGTTARTVTVDQTRLAIDQSAAR